MAKGNKVIKAGIGYTVGNILIKGINFLTLPLFSRLLTTEEFGVYNVFASYEAILYVVVGLSIHSSVRSANLEFKGHAKNAVDDYIKELYELKLRYQPIVNNIIKKVPNQEKNTIKSFLENEIGLKVTN